MSKLIHLCTKCNHSEHWHSDRNGKFTQCGCCKSSASPSILATEPVLVETYSLATGQPEPLMQPGQTWNAGNGHRQILCSCEACQTAYRKATA